MSLHIIVIVGLLVLCLLECCALETSSACSRQIPAMAIGVGRRNFLRNTALIGTAAMTSRPTTGSAEDASTSAELPFRAYQVVPDSSAELNPSLAATSKGTMLKSVAQTKQGGVVWLGEHHNSKRDHLVQEEIIRKVHKSMTKGGKSASLSIGLEQIQVGFQSVLDDYILGKIDLLEMREKTQWDVRWQWPFEGYAPIFETARELGLPLVALNVNSEDLAEVERYGLPGLSRDQISQYIPDPYGFAEFAKPKQFSAYVNYVIRPSYDLHKEMGLLRYTISGQQLESEMPFRNFFSGRILWDEAMASKAYQWTCDNPGGLMIGLVGADHVKFRDGIPGRFSRLAGETRDCSSVILNPTLIDTRPSGSVRNVPGSMTSGNLDVMTLQLRYVKDGVDLSSQDRFLPSSTGGVLPLADFIVMAKSIRSKAKRKHRAEFRKTIGAKAAAATMNVVQSKLKECIEKGSLNSFERIASALDTREEEMKDGDDDSVGVAQIESTPAFSFKGENKAPIRGSKKRKHKLKQRKSQPTSQKDETKQKKERPKYYFRF